MATTPTPTKYRRSEVLHRVRVTRIKQRVVREEWLLPEKYELSETIASGAFGVVVAARDTSTDESVAIKRVEQTFRSIGETKRLLREVKILKHLRHPNVVALRDVVPPPSFAEFQHLYLVFERCREDLGRIMTSRAAISDEHRKRYLYDMLRALKYIHSCNVIHRDLKPANILLGSDGVTLKICDFGLARLRDENGMTTYVTTRYYRAPELLMQSPCYDASVDVWSAACIFAEMFLRSPLFPGHSYLHQMSSIFYLLGTPTPEQVEAIGSQEARNWIATQPARAPQALASKIPQACDDAIDLLSKMLKFHPAERISVDEALAHPYFDSVRAAADASAAVSAAPASSSCGLAAASLPTSPTSRHLRFAFENKPDLTSAELKVLLWNEIRDLHPELSEPTTACVTDDAASSASSSSSSPSCSQTSTAAPLSSTSIALAPSAVATVAVDAGTSTAEWIDSGR